MRRDVFQAIADPTRRHIIQMLAQEPMTLNHVAGHFDVSRPAVSKHMKILAECGLVVIQQKGRERYCYAELERLQEVNEWTEQYRTFWAGKLDRLDEFLSRKTVKKK